MKQWNLNNYIRRLKNPNRAKLKQEITQEITDGDLVRYFGKSEFKNIIKYSELSNYKTINQLLPGKKSWKIILIEDQVNSGHWICVSRHNNTITVFNSYGGFPSSELEFMDDMTNRKLGQDRKYLNELLEDGLSKGFYIVYNKDKLQKLKDGYNTCGKWVILWLIMSMNFNMNLCSFIKFITNLSREYKLIPDEIVSLLISK